MRETGRDESQSVPSSEKLFKTRDLELPIFEGSVPSCSPHSAGYTRTSVHPYFPVTKAKMSRLGLFGPPCAIRPFRGHNCEKPIKTALRFKGNSPSTPKFLHYNLLGPLQGSFGPFGPEIPKKSKKSCRGLSAPGSKKVEKKLKKRLKKSKKGGF